MQVRPLQPSCACLRSGTGENHAYSYSWRYSFIGSHITASLLAAGHTVCAAARSGGSGRPAADGLAYATWDGKNPDGLRPLLEHADAVINLQGENIGAARWTRARKQAIVQSRLDAGYALVIPLHEQQHKKQRLATIPFTCPGLRLLQPEAVCGLLTCVLYSRT